MLPILISVSLTPGPYCPAPKANPLVELAILYQIYDPIAYICERNPSNITPPETGTLDPLDVENSEWVCI